MNDEGDRNRRRAKAQLSGSLRDLAANLIRVIRGAGKPHEVRGQTETLLRAFVAHYDAFGDTPTTDELANILSIELEPAKLEGMRDEDADRIEAEQQVIYAALQIVASRLLDQRTQETNGRRDFNEGVREIEKLRAEKQKRPPSRQ